MALARTLRRTGTYLWLPAVVVSAWWMASAAADSFYFPPLAEIVTTIGEELADGSMVSDIAFSLVNYTMGVIVATLVGIALGVALGAAKAVRDAVQPLLDFMRSMPQIALVPVVIMALGLGAAPKVFLIAFICFWPILLNTIDGVRSINPALIDVSRAYRIPYLLNLTRVVLPGATPSIMAGMRIAISMGVVMMVVSEMYASTKGIGFFILQSQESYRVAEVWAGTIVIGLLGYIITLGFSVFERLTLGWYFQTARGGRKAPARTTK